MVGHRSEPTHREVVSLPAIPLPDEHPTALAPSLFIGVGGTGAAVLTTLRSRLIATGIDPRTLSDVGWLQADTDEATLQRAVDHAMTGRLSHEEIVFLPLRTAQQYRDRPQEAYTPLSRRWLYNVPRSKNTEGVRPMGNVGLSRLRSAMLRRFAQRNDAIVGTSKNGRGLDETDSSIPGRILARRDW